MRAKLDGGTVVAGVLLLAAGFLTALLYPIGRETAAPVLAGPQAFAGPVSGGCYLATAQSCRVRVDSWRPLVVEPGQAIDAVRLDAWRDGAAQLSPLYDLATSVANPPVGSYQPSRVRQDFAAKCGATYELRVLVSTTSDPAYTETGRTNRFTCPAAAPLPGGDVYLPAVLEQE